MYSLFLFFFIVSVHTNLCKVFLPMKIIGGTKARIDSFPYMGNLLHQGHHKCAGSLISPIWVLTAAQCTFDDLGKRLDASIYQIVVGSLYIHGVKDEIKGDTQIRDVSAVMVSNFDHESSRKNDVFLGTEVAMFRTDAPFGLNNLVQMVRLLSPKMMKEMESMESFRNCMASGWGKVKNGDEVLEDMQYLKLSLTSEEKCRTLSKNNASDICSLDAKGKGGCFGDLGGPLVCQGYQIGVCSHMGCDGTNVDVWTRVDKFYNWITMTITFQNLRDKRKRVHGFSKSKSGQKSDSFEIVAVFVLMCQIQRCNWYIQ